MKIIGGKEIGGGFTPKPPLKGRCPFKPLVVGGRGESQELRPRHPHQLFIKSWIKNFWEVKGKIKLEIAVLWQ